MSDTTARPSRRTPRGHQALVRLEAARAEGGTGCWPWPGSLWPTGYGRCRGADGDVLPHRLAWKTWVGPIPPGQTVDHLCHTNALTPCTPGPACQHRRCVNPGHMELVTRAENSRRSHRHLLTTGKCKKGHHYAEHGKIRSSGQRYCGACSRDATTRCDRVNGHKPVHDWSETCPHGHLLAEGFLRISPKGVKCCRRCERDHARLRQGWSGLTASPQLPIPAVPAA